MIHRRQTYLKAVLFDTVIRTNENINILENEVYNWKHIIWINNVTI